MEQEAEHIKLVEENNKLRNEKQITVSQIAEYEVQQNLVLLLTK